MTDEITRAELDALDRVQRSVSPSAGSTPRRRGSGRPAPARLTWGERGGLLLLFVVRPLVYVGLGAAAVWQLASWATS